MASSSWVRGLVSDAQARLTLSRMCDLVKQAIRDREFVWWARGVVQSIAPKAIADRDYGAVAKAIRAYVATKIEFAPDPHGVENLTPPVEHMRLLRANPSALLLGDCDDAATLSAALGEAIGMAATFSARAFRSPTAPYQHVVTTLYPRGAPPLECDTTSRAQQLEKIGPPTRQLTITV